jgi:phage shock protein PspC (stress-responsive transcriptional regulator)
MSDDTISTIVIGLFALTVTAVAMYIIARGKE